MIRRAVQDDLDQIERIYQQIHEAQERGLVTTGWIRDVYPTSETAQAAILREDMFVLEEKGEICGCGIINQVQVDAYSKARWEHAVPADQVCVLHTLVISPAEQGKGYGREFLAFYEKYAAEHGFPELRLDTNARNTGARAMYKKHGYREIGIVPTVFNKIPGVDLVLLEKYLAQG